MDRFLKTVLFSSILVSVFVSSCAQNCSVSNNIFTSCNTLPVLNSYLYWNYHQANHTADIAYRQTGVTSSQWVAWALNVGGSGMVGAQCLVAFTNSSGLVRAYTTPVNGYGPSMAAGALSFNVPRISAELNNGEMVIFATLQLPTGSTSFNQVWQVGPVSGDTPQEHAQASANKESTGTVDFASGSTTSSSGGGGVGSRQRKKNVHGVLNVVSWGILVPIGAMTARYLKVFKSADPAWFYVHVACQCSAYIVGVAGWATGLKLGSESPIVYDTHRNIGITLFCLGTLQVFALLLRPKKDHKFRFYWNLYHWSVGYAVIILSIVNIFEGFDILDPEKKWKRAYIGVLIFLGATAVLLEAFTWFVVIKRKKSDTEKYPDVATRNGVNGHGGASAVNAYGGTRPRQEI
ncbi:hypothetical protein RJ639_036207 [Escallonia herrerae]|uniref:Cytochrome b561 and DOMON domain-containing protein n=1 Tax=Escallonia herrerae TaxID=1293975 RepID=A0AA88WR38_9ASTE|nr:hypothetical protein RJ639_036207 [Escallonia herrerae]